MMAELPFEIGEIAHPDRSGGSMQRLVRPQFRRVCDAATWWLRHTDNPAVGHGDAHLLHEIATLMEWEHASWRTERRVLNALSKTPGELIPTYVRYQRLCRNFYLPECCPERLRPNRVLNEPGSDK